MSVVTTWNSDVYRVLPMCHVYIEVGTKFSACECLLPYFLKLVCRSGDLSPVTCKDSIPL